MQPGDVLQLTDGKGTLAVAKIKSISKNDCFCELVESKIIPSRNYFIHLAIAPTKNSDRMEWMLEKCVELGLDKISLITTQYSERKKVNMERLHKIAVAAMKQSQQAWLPLIEDNLPFKKILNCEAEQKFMAHVDINNPHHLKNLATAQKKYLILIGPEGDFSGEEVEAALHAGFQKVSLGNNRLRTETAGLASCHILNLINS